MIDVILDTMLDTLKTLPFLFLVYLLLELMERRTPLGKLTGDKAHYLNPLTGALLGSVPQCGFSAAFAALYNNGAVGAATLAAVFLATSDEAIPVMLSWQGAWKQVILLIACKLVVAVCAGYLLQYAFFPKENPLEPMDNGSAEPSCACHSHHSSILRCALAHTVKISLFILITLTIINLAVFAIGEERLSKLLLSGTIFQPVLTALVGLIPGCATSVLLTNLYLEGSITFASAVAGLSTGAGFGYVILFRGTQGSPQRRKYALRIVASVFVAAVTAGMILQLLEAVLKTH